MGFCLGLGLGLGSGSGSGLGSGLGLGSGVAEGAGLLAVAPHLELLLGGDALAAEGGGRLLGEG